MKLKKSFKIALNIIIHSKLRSWLTIIGIVIGIAAVIAIVSIGEGAKKSLSDNLNSLSADIITISPGFSRAQGSSSGFRGPDSMPGSTSPTTTATRNVAKNLTVNDVMAIKTISNVKYAMGIISGNVENVTYLSKTSRTTVQGVDVSIWKDISTIELVSGRQLSQGDINVVVVGSRVNTTFKDIQINRQISIDGRMFRVVGILKESGGQDDSKIFMSIEDAIIVLDNKNKKNFDSIIVQVKDIELTDETITEITNKLMITHGILQASKVDFSVTSSKTVQERISSTLNSATIFLTAIAVISLIVGAIGIMNTMFTSVLEKTREIGILKAIGAKDKDILTIFLLNSAIIGIIGGVFGIILGTIISSYIGQLTSAAGVSGGGGMGRMLSSSYVSTTLVIEIFLLSVFIGLLSGAIPAYRASKLEPVDALRYE
ncbi:MAG: ABC transporter permease [Candidatus Pacearchaeota archaeon]|jgi:putative ABC transport system permease protein